MGKIQLWGVRDRTDEDGTQVLGGERDERDERRGGNERASLRKKGKELIDMREGREKE